MKHSISVPKLVTVTLLTLMLVVSTGPDGAAQNRGLTNADLKGPYGICLTFGANDGAGVAVVTADGNGFLREGWVLINVPSDDDKGGVVRGRVLGTYEINRTGTATVTLRFVLPDKVVDRTFDMIVRELDQAGIVELAGALRETTTLVPNAGATIELERLPDGGFDNSSLQGPLALNFEFEAQAAVAFGVVIADGKGNLVNGSLLINAKGADGQRVIVRAQVSGTYSVEPDGRLTLHLIITAQGQTLAETTVEGLILEAEEGEAPTETAARSKMKMIKGAHFGPRTPSRFVLEISGVSSLTLEQPGRNRPRLMWGYFKSLITETGIPALDGGWR
jgi:hypothetical protein